MKRIMYIELLLAVAVLFFLVPSCSKKWNGWERDYYSYQKGAYINGVQHHEKYDWNASVFVFSGKNHCGFSLDGRNNLVRARSSMSTLYNVWWSGPNDNNNYTINLWVYADSSSFKPGTSYSFKMPEDTVYISDLDKAFNSGSGLESFPVAVGYMAKGHDDFYTITEGLITFGAFRITNSDYDKSGFYYSGYNEERVSFCFTAENSEGKIITVEDGYINKYTTDYFVEYPVK